MNIGLQQETPIQYNKDLEKIEFAILEFGREKGITNPYWHFSQCLGYKSINHCYKLMKNDYGELKLKDVHTIIKITGKKFLAEVVMWYLLCEN